MNKQILQIIISVLFILISGCNTNRSHPDPMNSVATLADKSLSKISEINEKGKKTAGTNDIETIQELLRKRLAIEKSTEKELRQIVDKEKNKEIAFEQSGNKNRFIIKRIRFINAYLHDDEITITLQAEVEPLSDLSSGIECIIINQQGNQLEKEKFVVQNENSNGIKLKRDIILSCNLLSSKAQGFKKIVFL